MKIYIYLSILVFTLFACQEVYYPDVEVTEPSLVVDGLICTKPEKSRVIVSYSSTYSKNSYYGSVNGLAVYVTDTSGNRIDFNESGNTGVYYPDKNIITSVQIGNKYILNIETTEGDIYKSTPQIINEVPKIDKLYIEAKTNTILSEDVYGDIVEIDRKGISIYADTRAILPKDNYYLFRWYGYEEHRTTVGVPGQPAYDIYKHKAISSLYTNNILTGNADLVYGKQLRKSEFGFIPDFIHENFRPPVSPPVVIYKDFFCGYLIVSLQYSISKDAYIFWKAAQDQLESSGKLFDPVSSQINGNMSCINNSKKLILGVFYASDVETRFDYLYINSRNRVYSKELDSLPEIWTDTSTSSLPAGWIFPPF